MSDYRFADSCIAESRIFRRVGDVVEYLPSGTGFEAWADENLPGWEGENSGTIEAYRAIWDAAIALGCECGRVAFVGACEYSRMMTDAEAEYLRRGVDYPEGALS